MKRTVIRIPSDRPTAAQICDLLMNLSQRELRDVAKRNATPIKKYKEDTAAALATDLAKRGPTFVISINFNS